MRIRGTEHIPRKGPVILASNHLSNADPPVVGCAVTREIFFIAKQELFTIPVLGTAFRLVNAFPVKRGSQDIKAFKKAGSVLANGKILLMFPEGHRNPDGRPLRPKAGVGFLAAQYNVPVVPVRVVNTDGMMRFKKISVQFGKPVYFDRGQNNFSGAKSERYKAFAGSIISIIKTMHG